MYRECEQVRASLTDDLDITNDSHAAGIHLLRNLYSSIILADLDFALDKKIEQELWNVCFKVPISKLQPANPSPARNKKPESSPLLNWLLESATGFYLVLLQEICSHCNLDLNVSKRNADLGIFDCSTYQRKPKEGSCLYIIQHCLIHLGDLARYRNLPDEAEAYYKKVITTKYSSLCFIFKSFLFLFQAVQVDPSSGHPYNQLALLESARGDKLSALFYYVRSLALRHPFPPARSNLDKMLRKLSTQSLAYKAKTRLTVEEFVLSFLKLQAQIALSVDLDQADQLVKLLSLTLPSLMATETLTITQLVRMLAITIHNADSSASRSSRLAVEMGAAVLNACLASSCSLPAAELKSFRYLAAVKMVMEWFDAKPDLPSLLKRSGQLWSSTARLLNELQLGLDGVEIGGMKDQSLPEDVELLGFLPLESSLSAFRRSSKRVVSAQEEDGVRAGRIIQCGKKLAEKGTFLMATKQETGPELIFSAPEVLLADESSSPEGMEPSADVVEQPVKILARPPQRNVALTALMKQTADDAPTPPSSGSPAEETKVTKTLGPALLPSPLPPAKTSTGSGVYPRPALPPRLERMKAEQKEREALPPFSLSAGLPDITLPPPPPVPPPGLGFPLPPPAWSIGGPPPPVSYSLFNSPTWQPPGTGSTNLPPPAHFLPNFNVPDASARGLFGPVPNSASPAGSLWSGPGPSPLERLLEQQKALRSGTPGKNTPNNKPF